MKNITKISALAIFAVSAVAAQAFTIDIVSAGKVTNGATVDFDEIVLLQTTSVALPAFTDVDYSITNAVPPQAGAGTFTNALGDSVTYTMVLDSVTNTASTVSGSGSWLYTGGTGAYAGLAGDGTFAFTINTTTNSSYSSFSGNLDAVPEPVSMGVLSLGAVALLRRRSKKSV